jgi:hypothetical protein
MRLWARASAFGSSSLYVTALLKRLELGSNWAFDERGTDAHLWNDRAGQDKSEGTRRRAQKHPGTKSGKQGETPSPK